MFHFHSKLLLTAAIASLGQTTVASAADLPARTYTKAPVPPPVVVYNWTGFYLGGNGGYGWSANNNGTITGTDTSTGGILAPFGVPQSLAAIGLPLKSSGGLAGAQIGYNWQMVNWVFGLEADGDWADLKTSSTIVAGGGVGFNPGFSQVTVTGTKKLEGLETFRGRIGFLATPQFLLYATGGLALGQDKVGLQAVCPTCGPALPSGTQTGINTASDTKAGYAVGAGAEWMFAPQWSVKAEYLFADLGRQSTTIVYNYNGGGSSTGTLSTKQTYNIVRLGVNWHFGGPVVAAY